MPAGEPQLLIPPAAVQPAVPVAEAAEWQARNGQQAAAGLGQEDEERLGTEQGGEGPRGEEGGTEAEEGGTSSGAEETEELHGLVPGSTVGLPVMEYVPISINEVRSGCTWLAAGLA